MNLRHAAALALVGKMRVVTILALLVLVVSLYLPAAAQKLPKPPGSTNGIYGVWDVASADFQPQPPEPCVRISDSKTGVLVAQGQCVWHRFIVPLPPGSYSFQFLFGKGFYQHIHPDWPLKPIVVQVSAGYWVDASSVIWLPPFAPLVGGFSSSQMRTPTIDFFKNIGTVVYINWGVHPPGSECVRVRSPRTGKVIATARVYSKSVILRLPLLPGTYSAEIAGWPHPENFEIQASGDTVTLQPDSGIHGCLECNCSGNSGGTRQVFDERLCGTYAEYKSGEGGNIICGRFGDFGIPLPAGEYVLSLQDFASMKVIVQAGKWTDLPSPSCL